MSKFSLRIAADYPVILSHFSPCINLLFVSKVLNGHEEHAQADGEWILTHLIVKPQCVE